MLKFETIIRNLSLDEKIELLISSKKFENGKIKNYDFPNFKVENYVRSMYEKSKLLSPTELAATWNTNLIERCGREIAKDIIRRKNETAISINLQGLESYSEAPYVNGKFAAAFIRGAQSAGLFTCVNKIPNINDADMKAFKEKDILPGEIAILEGNPSAAITANVNNSRTILDDWKYNGLKICEAKTETEIVRSLTAQNEITIIENKDINAKEIIKKALENYELKQKELEQGQITRAEFDELVRNGESLDPSILDGIIDHLLYSMAYYASAFKSEDITVDESALQEAANESVILVKNDSILPIGYDDTVAVIGEACKESYDGISSVLTVSKEIDIRITDFSLGYNGEVGNDSLRFSAINTAKSSQQTVLFLRPKKLIDGSFGIPSSQLEVLYDLYKNDVKVIAVVSTSRYDIDFAFTEYCHAVIIVGALNKFTIKAVLNSLTGENNPCGHLPMALKTGEVEKYSVGHGLSYSIFEYRSFEVTRKGVSFTVENGSEYPGSDVMQVYVQREGEEAKYIKGFAKYFVKARDYQKVFIDFDDKTFRTFNPRINKYGIEGGKYKVIICRSLELVDYEFDLHLDQYYELPNAYESFVTEEGEEIEGAIKEFAGTEDRIKFFKEKRGFSFGKKLLIAIPLVLYFYAMFGYLALRAVETENDFQLLISAALLGITTIAFIIFLVKAVKARKKYKEFNDDFKVLEKLENLKDFQEEYRESFLVREDAENIKREYESQKEMENTNYSYKVNNFVHKEDNTEFSETLSFENICPEFISFALSRGLILEPASVRLLFSALSSTRLVFFRSLRSDLLPRFVEVLNEYLENHHVIVNIDENIEKERDLLWTLNSERQYEKSEFTKSLYQAKAFKNHINVITLNNVDVNDLGYFESFYRYCDNFNDTHYVDLGTDDEQEIFEIPNNVYFIMIPNDYNYLDSMPKGLAECSFSIELNIRENEIQTEEVEKQNVISFKGLEELMKLEKGLFFLPEDTWKSFDEIEEQLSAVGHFRLENKPILQIERFSTALLGCGADVIEVIDSILACKYIPITKSFKNLKNKAEVNTVLDVILKVFDEETIPNSLKLLKRIETEELVEEEKDGNETAAEETSVEVATEEKQSEEVKTDELVVKTNDSNIQMGEVAAEELQAEQEVVSENETSEVVVEETQEEKIKVKEETNE